MTHIANITDSVAPLRVNFVMSDTTPSGIFADLNKYFLNFLPENIEIHVSEEALPECDIYHYHRPNIANEIHSPAVTTVHHDLDDNDPWLDFSKYYKKYVQMDKIVCLNTMQRDILVSHGIPSNKLMVQAHGYNTQLLKPKASSPCATNEKITIGIISRRYGRRVKGDAYLMELSKRLNPQHYRFIIVGQSRHVTAHQLLEFGFEVECIEAIPYRIIQSFYDSIDVLLMCSEFEGGPANIPEAIATHTPVITTDIGMSHDLIKEGINGHFLTGNLNDDARIFNSLYVNESKQVHDLRTQMASDNNPCDTWQDVVTNHASMYLDLAQLKTNQGL